MRALTRAAAVAATALMSPAAACAGVAEALAEALAAAPACSREAAALSGTIARMAKWRLPGSGRAILVNIPAQTLVAYEDGEPVLDMPVVVGAPATPTPALAATVSFVRFNPSWTVPRSILAEPEWQARLADPAFLERNGFAALAADGRPLPHSAAPRAATLVQAPGERNALGAVKIGLRGGGAIYLHDTNDQEGFDEELRAASHGCVRLGDPFPLAAWLLGIGRDDAEAAQASGDAENRAPRRETAVVLAYFTAWPDADGRVHYYPDIYGLDGARGCRGETTGEVR